MDKKFGEQNVIAVKIDHSLFADSRWYTGSGIYRDVKLITTAPVRIKQWGVFVTTPLATKQKAIIRIDVTLVNEIDEKANQVAGNLLVYGSDTIKRLSNMFLLMQCRNYQQVQAKSLE